MKSLVLYAGYFWCEIPIIVAPSLLWVPWCSSIFHKAYCLYSLLPSSSFDQPTKSTGRKWKNRKRESILLIDTSFPLCLHASWRCDASLRGTALAANILLLKRPGSTTCLPHFGILVSCLKYLFFTFYL